MRINIVSDLHDDICDNRIERLPDVDADVTVVAGDAAAPGTLALRRVRELYPDRERPLIYTGGNHDYYSWHDKHHPELKTTIERQRAEMPAVAAELGIILLDDSAVEIDGVRFAGGTLWTDFRARPPWTAWADAVRDAEKRMNDYKLIKREPGRSRDRLRPGQTIDTHKSTVEYLESLLARPFEGDTVIVTHHAPSYRSLVGYDPENPKIFGQLDWCYASDLERLMYGNAAPALWVHGHIHANRDYWVGNTRVVANPRGYPSRPGVRENPDFDPTFVVELEPRLTATMRM